MAVLAAMAAVLFMALPAPAVGRELLENGGFEEAVDGVPVGWGFSGGTLTQAEEPRLPDGSYSGKFSTLGAGDLLSSDVRQVYVPARAGGVYQFSGFIWMEDSNIKEVRLQIRWRDAQGEPISKDECLPLTRHRAEWQRLLVDLADAPPRTQSAHAVMFVQSEARGATVYLDGMSFLEEISPPTATATSTATPSPTLGAQATATPLASATPALSATPAPTVLPTPSHGLLINGGFEAAEEGMPVGWRKHGGILWQASSPVRSGSTAGAFWSETESTKWVYQTVAVEGEAWYSFEGYVYANDAGVAASFLRISWYGSADGSGRALSAKDSLGRLESPAAGFRYLTTGSVQAPPPARSAKVRIVLAPLSAAPATIFLDDMTFAPTSPATPTPEGTSTPTPAATAARTVGPGSPSAAPGEPHAELSPRTSEARGAARAPGSLGEPSPFSVKINEVLYDPETEDRDAAHEWVELYNASPEPVELEGWSIADNLSTDVLPGLHLEAGDFAVVAASERFRNDWPDYDGPLAVLDDGRLGNGLSNRGDCLTLRDTEGRIVDALSYGEDSSILEPPVPAVPADHSLERRPAGRDTNTAADFVDNPHPSPGFGLAGPGGTPTATLISEVSSIAWEPARDSGGAGWWPWALAGGLVASGVGAGTALVVRLRRRPRGRGAP